MEDDSTRGVEWKETRNRTPRVFESIVYAHVPEQAEESLMIGARYAFSLAMIPVPKLYDPYIGKVSVSRDVEFDEEKKHENGMHRRNGRIHVLYLKKMIMSL